MTKKKDRKPKQSNKVEIELGPEQTYFIVNKRASLVAFTDVPNSDGKFNVELTLPNKEDVKDLDHSNAINMAMGVVVRLKHDKVFAQEMLNWLADHITSIGVEQN